MKENQLKSEYETWKLSKKMNKLISEYKVRKLINWDDNWNENKKII